MSKLTVRDVEVNEKRVLVRVDFNVPLDDNGKVSDDTRIRASVPTINYLLKNNARVILMTHLGRPKGEVKEELRLNAVCSRLKELLETKVRKVDTVVGKDAENAAAELKAGEVLLLENMRFEPGEEKNDLELAQKLAQMGDLYVNDAFGTAHRAHASTEGVARYLPAVSGLLLEKEINVLDNCLHKPERPFTAIFGGAKVSDKIGVIRRFLDVADYLLIGGGMANTFLAAKGYDMGNSFYESSKLDVAKELLELGEQKNNPLHLPDDVVVAEELVEGAACREVAVDAIPEGWQSVDIGPITRDNFSNIVRKSSLVVWNGPVGVFEVPPFHRGTEEVTRAAVNGDAYVLVGGGDTASAMESLGVVDKIGHVSTGGGATLEYLEGKDLPGISILKEG